MREFIWTLKLLAEISFSPKLVCFIHTMFGKGKPSELQVKLAVTPLKVDSTGASISTKTPRSKTKGLRLRNSSSLLLIHMSLRGFETYSNCNNELQVSKQKCIKRFGSKMFKILLLKHSQLTLPIQTNFECHASMVLQGS